MTAVRFIVNLDVPDLDAAAEFYCTAFGLERGRSFGPHAQELLGGPTELYLLKKDEAPRNYSRHWTPAHLDFLVDDIETAKAQVLSAGATLEADTKTSRWGKLATFADPWGHGFCLIEFVGRGYDEIAHHGIDARAE